jgi:hypothetical protein
MFDRRGLAKGRKRLNQLTETPSAHEEVFPAIHFPSRADGDNNDQHKIHYDHCYI